MYNDSAMIMMLHTLTSTHPGSGTELSYVDLPIQREGHTGYPKIEASTLKGCIRAHVGNKNKKKSDLIDRIFGKPDNSDYASALSVTDARLLFFPVKSVKGVFGWVTCPMVLNRFFNDYRLTFGKDFSKAFQAEQGGICSKDSELSQKMNGQKKGDVIMLEDYTYVVEEDQGAFTEFLNGIREHLPDDAVAKDMILKRAVILNDDDFAGFVKYSTEVNTRIRIDPSTGTVAGTALFTEEYLPPECVLYSLLFFTEAHQAQKQEHDECGMNEKQVKEAFLELFPDGMLQVGANSTLGKGLIQVKKWEEQ